MKTAIINLINAIAKLLTPHEHDWELINEAMWSSAYNKLYSWTTWTYVCKKCCECKTISNESK